MLNESQSRLLIFLVIVAVTTLCLLIFFGRIPSGQLIGRDFTNVWVASSLIQDHRINEIYENEKFNQAVDEIMQEELALHGFLYPPNSAWLVVPFSYLPYSYSFVLWSFIGLIAYLFACGAPDWNRLKIAALLLAPTTLLNLHFGQNGLISAALIGGGFMLLQKKPIMAGICFGLLSYKPTLGVLIPIALLFGRYWISFISASLVTVATVLLGTKIMGADAWISFFNYSVPFGRALIEHGKGPLMHLMPSSVMTARVLGLDSSTGYWIQLFSALYAISGIIWTFSKDAPVNYGMHLYL